MRVIAVLVVVLVAVAFAEAVVRRLERRLPVYLHWHDLLTTGKWHQLRRLRRQDPVDILLAGSSQMLTALDPTALPGRCYNAALYRGVPTLMTQWLADEVLPATRPRLVVWGLSILDLNDNGPFHRDITDRYETAPARCRGPLRALFWLRVHSALVRRAGLLARPVHSARVLRRGDETRKPLSRLLGPMGKGLEYVHADSYRLSEQKREFIETQIVPDFSMGGRQIDALRRGAAVVQASAARLMFLEMPCGPEFRAMYPRGDSDVDQARDLLQRVAGEVGAGWLDPGSGELPLNWYADPVHLNGVGMARWTEEVGSALARAGEAPNPVAVVEEATSGVG